MSPLMQRTLENKNERRKRLMALPYPEKLRIVEQMRAATGEMKAAARHASVLHEETDRPRPRSGESKIQPGR